LDAALATVQEQRQKLEETGLRLGRLKAGAPDLAELVREERITLDQGLAAMAERQRVRRETIKKGADASDQGLNDFIASVDAITAAYKVGARGLLDPKRVEAACAAAELLRRLLGASA
jgi:hypothetical protein